MDQDWTFILIRQAALNNSWALAFIVSHLSTAYTAGTINYYSRGSYYNPEWQPHSAACLTSIPYANSVSIRGPKRPVLVLIDCTAQSCPRSIRVNGDRFSVYVGQDDYVPGIFTESLYAYYTYDNLNRIQRDFFGAFTELANTRSCSDALRLALALAS